MDLENLRTHQQGMDMIAEADKQEIERELARRNALEKLDDEARKALRDELRQRKIKIIEGLMDAPTDGEIFEKPEEDSHHSQPVVNWVDSARTGSSRITRRAKRVVNVLDMGSVLVSTKHVRNQTDSENRRLNRRQDFYDYDVDHAQSDAGFDGVEIAARAETSRGSYDLKHIAHASINPMANEDIAPSAQALAESAEALDSLENIAATVGIEIEAIKPVTA